jgi:hypothetical protein
MFFFFAGLQQPGSMKSAGSSPARLQQLHYGSQGSFGGPATSSQLEIANYLLGGGMAGPGGSMSVGNLAQQQQAQQAAAAAAHQQHQQQAAAAAAGQQAQQAAAAAALMGGSMGDMAGMARSFSELSLQSDLNRVAMVGAGGQMAAGGNRLTAGTMSTGDLLNLQQQHQQQQQQQQGLGRAVGPMGLRGIASTGSIWSSATQQVSRFGMEEGLWVG